jgi:hypothetical protein
MNEFGRAWALIEHDLERTQLVPWMLFAYVVPRIVTAPKGNCFARRMKSATVAIPQPFLATVEDLSEAPLEQRGVIAALAVSSPIGAYVLARIDRSR